MSRSSSGRRWSLVSLAMLLGGCLIVSPSRSPVDGPEGAVRRVTPGSGGQLISRTKLVAENLGGLRGQVLGPDAALVSDKGGGLIANNGGGLISNNGGGLISRTKYGLFAAAAPAAGVEVAVYDDRGERVSAIVTTDAQGRYQFSRLQPSSPALFVRATYEAGGHRLTLEAAAAAPREAGWTDLPLDPASTLMAKKAGEMLRLGAIAPETLDTAALRSAAETVAPAMSDDHVVASVLLPAAQVARAFDDLVEASAGLRQKLAGVLDASLLGSTPAKPVAPTPAPSGLSPTPTPSSAATLPPAATPTPAATATPAAEKHPLPAGAATVEVNLDGAANAAAAIQQAIDGLGAAGGIVKLPAGTFTLGTSLRLASKVHLVGTPGLTVLVAGAAKPLVEAHAIADASIRDVVLDGAGLAGLSAGINASDAERLVVLRCEVKRTEEVGVNFAAAVADSAIEDNHLHQIGEGSAWGTGIVVAWGSARVRVAGNRIENTSSAGVFVHDNSSTITVEGNTAHAIGGGANAIEFQSGCSGAIRDNRVSARIVLRDSQADITDNVIDGALNGGAVAGGIDLSNAAGVQVARNTVKNVGMGLYIGGSQACRITDNTFEDVGDGVYAENPDGPLAACVLEGNTWRRGQLRGVYLGPACNDWQFVDNVIEDFGRSGVYMVNTDGVVLESNQIRRCGNAEAAPGQEAGLFWGGSPKTRLTLTGNALEGNVRDYLGVPAQFLP